MLSQSDTQRTLINSHLPAKNQYVFLSQKPKLPNEDLALIAQAVLDLISILVFNNVPSIVPT